MNLSLPLRNLSPRAMKGAAILLVSAILLLLLAVLPFVWHASLSEQAAAQLAERDRVKARVLAHADARGRMLTDGDQPQNMFLPGTTAGTTLAAFQTIVSDAAGASGISVLRMQPLPGGEVRALGLSPRGRCGRQHGTAAAFPCRYRIDAAAGDRRWLQHRPARCCRI